MGKKNIVLLLSICGLILHLNSSQIFADSYQSTSTPTNLSLASITGGFLVTWDSNPGGAAVYKIYWGNDESLSEENYAGILTTGNTEYAHTGLVPGRNYYYRIMACDCECSQLSNPVSAVYQPGASGDVYILSGKVTVNGALPGATDPTVTPTVWATEVSGANLGNSVSVNPDGTFRMALFSGTYNISVDYWFGESWHGTWINFNTWDYPGPQNLSISADVSKNIDIVLHSLIGTVKDTDGNPVSDVELSYSLGSTATSAEAGFEGVYKLYFLPGTYSLQVNPPAGTRFCPITVETNIPGEAPAIELRKQRLLSGTVSVSGVDPGMTDQMRSTVRATEVSGANLGNSVSVNSDGTFQMALMPGTYNISVDCWFDESWHGTPINFGAWGLPGPQNLTISADASQNIDVVLHSLTGTVKDTDGNPVPGAGLNYNLGSATTSAEAGFEGAYKLYFPSGTYSLQVNPPAGSRFGAVSVDVNIPGEAPAIELQKQPLLSGTITANGVTIQPGMPDPTVTATVRATEVSGANPGNSASVKSDGTFQMALMPGTYNISVDYRLGESWHGTPINFGAWRYPGPQNLSISADASQDIDIALRSLSGTVKDTGDNPVAGVGLSYSGPSSYGAITTSAEAGFEGAYKLYFLQGTYSMQVTAPPALFPPFQVKRIDIMEDAVRNIALGQDRTVLDQAMALLPPQLELRLDILAAMTNGATNAYDLVVSASRDRMQLIVNWADSEMQVSVYRPDGSLYDQYQPDAPPVVVDIQNPEAGTWTCEVAAINVSNDSCPVAVVAGFTPNQLPVADAAGPYSGTAGTPVIFDAGNSHDPDPEGQRQGAGSPFGPCALGRRTGPPSDLPPRQQDPRRTRPDSPRRGREPGGRGTGGDPPSSRTKADPLPRLCPPGGFFCHPEGPAQSHFHFGHRLLHPGSQPGRRGHLPGHGRRDHHGLRFFSRLPAGRHGAAHRRHHRRFHFLSLGYVRPPERGL